MRMDSNNNDDNVLFVLGDFTCNIAISCSQQEINLLEDNKNCLAIDFSVNN